MNDFDKKEAEAAFQRKASLAAYAASLITLLESQDSAGGHLRSGVLAKEFTSTWEEFKQAILDDEARKQKLRDAKPTKEGHHERL